MNTALKRRVRGQDHIVQQFRIIEVPYGIVLPADSPKGLAVPITDALREALLSLLAEV